MESITIRNLPDGTKAALRRRAADNGRSSVEAEVRDLIAEAIDLVDGIGRAGQRAYPTPRMSASERAAWLERCARTARKISKGRILSDSTPMIREDRERR